MLYGLNSMMREIADQRLDEADVYRREKAYERVREPRPAAGFLHCPVCGESAARFLPFGLANRPNAQCPTCGSIERHRLMWLYLNEHTDLFLRRHRVLHTAPEPCLEHRLRAHHGRRYVSVDAFNPLADVQADLTDLPFPEASFDVILSSHVLEHVENDTTAIAELGRVLKPRGWALILVPYDPAAPTREDSTLNTPALRMAAYGHPYHYRIYGTDFTDRLRGGGLEARVISTNRLLQGHRKRRFRINRNYMMLCRKT